MIIQHTVNRYGAEYTYFFCRNKQDKTCATPHISVAIAEEAVEQHYATIMLSHPDLDALRDHLAAIADDEPAEQLLHTTISSPHDLYRRCSEGQRRLLNQAIFRRLYIADGRITDHDQAAGPDFERKQPRCNRTNASSEPDTLGEENPTSALTSDFAYSRQSQIDDQVVFSLA